MIILGIDPGIKGGLAVVDASDGKLLEGCRMPVVEVRGKPEVSLPRAVKWLFDSGIPDPDLAVVEQVGAMPKQGVASSFRFGMAYGAALDIASMATERVERVTPAVWKKHFGLSNSKRASLDAAEQRFGAGFNISWTTQANDGIAEAALLAAWWIDKQASAR